ncbi:phosphoribosylformylglycinamidine synthase [Synechococcus phage S-MbCM6]|jgi:hypothetical protein|uniref:Phosphoribosylformylglycinamidine synthase n=4 Tax=Namakavirus smbcm6 TaxID=2734120 RepID=H8ZMN2_9CAUD|nr:phosphoribosylformylglycinamidine synthase [Synechococcus phage ACG-2014c]AFD02743.1 phosphoribosylformylglycinamidine synthase [Synechococcus phage ACG-2014c]AHB80760.1 hypothetical protein S-MbCM25_125 [Synechococcus phage S-MbCM25]AIX14521.1 phosphoribosylformylglycinamidine synthase [Synechococcus phage ACG-2014c]AIX22678.1 phosphoribosylformylglycinamidine synthase [Synechococcus phage ACG-2014c]
MMDDFNTPGSNKTWMDDGFKKYAAEWQLNNVVSLLNAEVKRCHVYNSDNRDEVYNQITITYKQED